MALKAKLSGQTALSASLSKKKTFSASLPSNRISVDTLVSLITDAEDAISGANAAADNANAVAQDLLEAMESGDFNGATFHFINENTKSTDSPITNIHSYNTIPKVNDLVLTTAYDLYVVIGVDIETGVVSVSLLGNIKGGTGEKGEKGEKGEQGEKGEKGDPGEDGYSPVITVLDYGAAGNGVADDTKAFQNALANNRVVLVPGGSYVLSGTLVIRENCCMELSQDTILKFTQTSGNCIEMRGSAVLRGNHAVISAAYGLAGNVISMDTSLDGTNHASIPPYAKADPQWKRQRFVYDVNIVKPNSAGFNRPLDDGKCNGTAIYMSAKNVSNDSSDIAFMWGVTMSGIRIAGGFSYGIHAINYDSADGSTGHYADDAWNHDMRIEAVIEGCEIGVALENCNGAHLNVTVQPNTTVGGTKYAKQGICLKDSRFVDMLRSRVWDWHVGRNDSEEYKHIALYGNCRGLLLDDFLVTEHPDTDIRDDIYTDTPGNFDTMTILQEPANKWFKSVDGVPYFNDGTANRKLMLATDKFTAEQAEFIHPADGYYTYEPNFTNLVTGYTDGKYLAGGSLASLVGYVTTDYIPIDGAAVHTYRIGGEGIVWGSDTDSEVNEYCRIEWYDADKKQKGGTMAAKWIGSSIYYPVAVEDETVAAAFATTANMAPPNGAAYFRITAKGSGANLVVTLDEKQEYDAVWHGEPKRLDESIYSQNLVLKSPDGSMFKLNISNSGGITTEKL